MLKRLVYIVTGLLLAACATPIGPATPAGAATLTVFAAASLTDAFKEIGAQFEAQHPGVNVEFNFAGSQQLRQQLEQGARADLFASANTTEMTGAISAGLIVSGTPQVFARNRLALVVPKDNRAGIQTPADLARPGLKIVLATAAVPVGGYALATLGRLNQVYGATYSQTVLANVVSYEDNVKQVVAKVQLGEADAGIVYTSDVTPAAAAQLTKIEIPDEYNVVASYPIAPLKAASQAGLAADFVQLTVSDQGQAILQKWGFIGR